MKTKKMKRRDFLKTAAITGGVLAAGIGYKEIHDSVGRDFQPDRAKKYLESIQPGTLPGMMPNILVILCDDLGYGDLQSPAIATPNLKQMAAEGMQLTNFYAPASVCSPSRAGLMTGRYPVRTLISTPLLSTYDAMNVLMDVLGRYSYNVQGIPEDEILLSEVLKQRGYRTGIVGKWHLGGTRGHIPNDRGFDSFYGALWSNDDQPYAIYRDREVAVSSPADENVLTRDFTHAAQDFIRSNADHPFFLYLAHAMPHFPVHASESFRGKSIAGLYGDAIQEVDWGIGQVFQTLDELGLKEKTLVIFSSDNGPWQEGNPGYQRGRKLTCFEGGFRVPFIARWPGMIPAGFVNPAMCINFDLFPTALQLAGVTLPQDRIIDGMDILNVLRGDKNSAHDKFYYYDTRTLVAMRKDHWKYFRRHTTDNGSYWPTSQGPFLFDLDTDPNESYSLIPSQPERAAEMVGMMESWEKAMKTNLRGWL